MPSGHGAIPAPGARERGDAHARPGPVPRTRERGPSLTNGRSAGRIARALRAGALVLAAGAACPAPAGAEEREGRWFDFLSDLLKRPEGAPLEVPLRKKRGREEAPPAPAAEGDALGEPPAPEVEGDAPGEPPAPEVEADMPAEPPPAANPTQPPPPAERPARIEGAGLAQVARAVEDLVAEIELLREASGEDAPVVQAEPLDDRAPVHLYVKTLEVLAKVTHVQRRLGMPAGAAVRIPFKTVDAPDVLGLVEHALGEVRRVKAHTGVERDIAPAAPEPAGTPSALYRRLAHASFLLDALRGGAFTSADVHRHALGALDEVALIGGRLGVAVALEPPPAHGAKTPVEVAQQLLRAAFKVVNLQRRLDMDDSRPPAVRLDHADTARNYDLVNLLLAELARIKWHLGIDAAPPERPAPLPGTGADEAFAVAQSIVAHLDRLSDAAAQ